MDLNTESDRRNNHYYMVFVNCKYKRVIHQLLKDLKRINGLRRDPEDKYAPLKRDLLNLRDMPIYRAVENDEGD